MSDVFDDLQLPAWTPARFRSIGSLMPKKVDLTAYYAVFTQGYLFGDEATAIEDFAELFARSKLVAGEQSLQEIRKRGRLYEGDKVFPPGLGKVLCPRGGTCMCANAGAPR